MQKIKPFRSQKYKDWVKQLPSCISGLPADDPHHIKGRGYGGSVKPSDLFTMPLTREEHDDFHRIGWESWEAKHNVDQRDLVIATIERAIREGVIK